MNGKELKMCLSEYAKVHGISSFTEIELDFFMGKISYLEYLNRCYDDFVKDDSVNIPKMLISLKQ